DRRFVEEADRSAVEELSGFACELDGAFGLTAATLGLGPETEGDRDDVEHLRRAITVGRGPEERARLLGGIEPRAGLDVARRDRRDRRELHAGRRPEKCARI